jgi:hypothetical protein
MHCHQFLFVILDIPGDGVDLCIAQVQGRGNLGPGPPGFEVVQDVPDGIRVPAIRLLTIIGLALLGPRFTRPPGSNISTAHPAAHDIGWDLAPLQCGAARASGPYCPSPGEAVLYNNG